MSNDDSVEEQLLRELERKNERQGTSRTGIPEMYFVSNQGKYNAIAVVLINRCWPPVTSFDATTAVPSFGASHCSRSFDVEDVVCPYCSTTNTSETISQRLFVAPNVAA